MFCSHSHALAHTMHDMIQSICPSDSEKKITKTYIIVIVVVDRLLGLALFLFLAALLGLSSQSTEVSIMCARTLFLMEWSRKHPQMSENKTRRNKRKDV